MCFVLHFYISDSPMLLKQLIKYADLKLISKYLTSCYYRIYQKIDVVIITLWLVVILEENIQNISTKP